MNRLRLFLRCLWGLFASTCYQTRGSWLDRDTGDVYHLLRYPDVMVPRAGTQVWCCQVGANCTVLEWAIRSSWGQEDRLHYLVQTPGEGLRWVPASGCCRQHGPLNPDWKHEVPKAPAEAY